ncbi:hypothetical protein AB0M20_31980 [Actinoplanes sp. NPDC051633]|uniref:hypothetical protein n=1 Tax=Actinoplanes sp. NPDC051633 TaxID=3155670 RepID=UPI003448DE8A
MTIGASIVGGPEPVPQPQVCEATRLVAALGSTSSSTVLQLVELVQPPRRRSLESRASLLARPRSVRCGLDVEVLDHGLVNGVKDQLVRRRWA